MHLLLTTYPEHKSQNVGDNLIAQSTIRLIRQFNRDFDPTIVFRGKALDGFSKKKVRHIIAPGFSVANGVYPDLFPLYTDLNRLINFHPVGCSFQHIIPSRESFSASHYDDRTKEFLKLVVDRSGPLPCRDQLIADMLTQQLGLPAYYSGDMAIYDADYLGSDFAPPGEIQSLVFTVQHHLQYLEQSIELLKRIKAAFPGAKRYVALHSKPNAISSTVAARAAQLGFETLHQYGDIAKLEAYKAIDLHIGYRLHGHICFLRYRKPSILMVEDARSFGFAQTPGTAVGCFDAFDTGMGEPDAAAPARAMDFLQGEIAQGFQGYKPLFGFVDQTYREIVEPYFRSLAAQL
ncbi:MAG: polysaccharide pyruvyl transferase family protein [Rhodospirillaceae bacterium]|nr:polysaccharide pyruvyl transferase family protein [Rhodospirillaceae bacterium]